MKSVCYLLLLAVFSATVANAAATPREGAQKHDYGQFHFYTAVTPDWVKPAKIPKTRGKPQGQSTEYALLDTQIYADPNNYQRYKAYSYYLHNSQAVSENSEVEIFFNPDYQELQIHKLQLLRGKETIDLLRPELFRLLQQEDDLRKGIYHGAVTAIAILPNTRPGDRLDYSYTITGRNPVYGDKVFGAHNLGWSVDVGLSRVRLLVPANIPLQTRVHDIDLKYKKSQQGDWVEHTWTAKHVPGRADEGDYPKWFVRYPLVEYSQYQSWQEVAGWAQSLYDSVDQNAPELESLVAKLQKSATDSEDYALAALDFTQEQIRYLGLEFGLNSHLPHSPAEVLQNRYGDCKDKSNLLVQLLQRNGIAAYPTLVSYDFGKGFTDFLPSPLAFDHVIVNAYIDDQQVWLDPTRTYQAGRLKDRAQLEFGSGLIVDERRQNPVIEIAALPEQLDRVEVTETFTARKINKPVKLEVETEFRGEDAEFQRYYFNSYSLDEISDFYINAYAKLYPKISLDKPVRFKDNRETNTLTVYQRYEIPEFFEKQEGLFQSNYHTAAITEHLKNLETIRRQSPAAIGLPRAISHKIIVNFMGEVGMTIDSTPQIKKHPALEYRSRSVLIKSRFEHQARLWIKQPWVMLDTIDDYVNLAKFIQNDSHFTLNFAYPYKQQASPAVNALLKTLD